MIPIPQFDAKTLEEEMMKRFEKRITDKVDAGWLKVQSDFDSRLNDEVNKSTERIKKETVEAIDQLRISQKEEITAIKLSQKRAIEAIKIVQAKEKRENQEVLQTMISKLKDLFTTTNATDSAMEEASEVARVKEEA